MMDLRDSAERIMPRCGNELRYLTLVIYAISLYLHFKANKWSFNHDHMVQKSIEDFFIPLKISYL